MDSGNLDFMGICLDEVALEGLDGITIPSLWKRINKHGKFPLPLDDQTKQFVWECMLQHKDLQLFMLQEPRLPLLIYNRYSHVDLEMGIVMDADESVYDIYPYNPVQSDSVRGSCATFSTREDITSELRLVGRKLPTMLNRYGAERIVVVASQELRNRALLGTEVQPNLELSLEQYCILERIGRSRYHGEVTFGRISLSQTKLLNKRVFYVCRLLLRVNLITKQVHLQRVGNATQHSSLLHLRRFYVERLSNVQVMVMKMCKILQEKPNKQELFHVLRSELGMKEGSFKKMFNKTYQVCVQAKMMAYGELYPDAPKEKRFSMNGKERQVKVAVLVKNYDDQEEEDYEEEEEEKNQVNFSMDPRKMMFDRPILSQLYNIIENAGPNGITSNSLRNDLGIPKLDVRLLIRNLERRKSIFSLCQDMGRQRTAHYVAKCFEQENLANNQLLEMKQKILNYSSNQQPNEELQFEEIYQRPEHGEFNELDSVVVEYLEDDQSEVLTKSWNFSLKDINTACKTGKDRDAPNLTYKMLKRVNLVIEAVHRHRLIEDPFRIQKLIAQVEQEEGHTEKIDKKSTFRIISRLSRDGYIRSIKTRLTMGNTVKKLHFICASNITPDDPLVQSAIEQAKLKYFSLGKVNVNKTPVKSSSSSPPREVMDSGLELKNMANAKDVKMELEYIPAIGRAYGLLPKYPRMKALHLLLFYLVHDYEGSQTPVQMQDENSPAVYKECETWKRFVPPLPQHAGKTKGWCLVSDIILSMPLSLLLKLVNYTYKIQGIEVFLEDPIKRHYLLRHLPQEIRNLLLHSRKYIFSVHEVMTKLAFMGLLSFGLQQYKEKDQQFVYIHQNTSIKDTTLSERRHSTISPDLNYHTTKYHLTSNQDVEGFWYDLEVVCLRTPLGASKNSTDVVKNIFHDPAMIEATRPKTQEEICDNGVPPGDGQGAAGFDSSMFAHLKRNWCLNTDSISHSRRFPTKKDEREVISSCPVGVSYMKYLAERDQEVVAVSEGPKTKRLSRLTGKNKLVLTEPQVNLTTANDSLEEKSLEEESSKIKSEIKSSVVPNVVSRKGYKRKSTAQSTQPKKRVKRAEKRYKERVKGKPRRPYYDEKDQIALNKMSTQRVCWSVQEDSFLLLCKVSSCFLDPHHKGLVIPFSMIREIMHARFPLLSYNKTSRACQRRVSFMMRNPATVANVSVFLLEAKQDVELVRQFLGPKPTKKNEKAWTEMFNAVLNHLLEKFSLSLKDRCTQLVLPSSSEEFNKRYKVSVTGDIKDKCKVHNEPKNQVDIHCSVMFCFILGSMFTIGDKNNWSYTLYRAYQQYPDTLLRSVVGRLKRDRLITKRKEFNIRTELTIPLSSLPHKLSVHFEMNLQTRYQSYIYERAAELFKLITTDYSLPEPQGVGLNGHIEPGDTALILSLNATENVVFKLQVPEQVVIFDSAMTDDMKTKIKERVKKYKEEDAEDLDDENKPTNEPSTEDPLEVTSSGASRIALYMLRHELDVAVRENLQHAQDYFLINTCDLRCILRLPEQKRWYPLSPFKAQCAMDMQRVFLPLEAVKPTRELVLKTYLDHGYSDDVSQDGVNLMMHILEKRELGCTFLELFDYGLKGSLGISDHLKYLVSCQLVVRVGVMCFRYVSLFYSKPWVLNSIKVSKEERSAATEVASQHEKQVLEEEKAKRPKLTSHREESENSGAEVNIPSNAINSNSDASVPTGECEISETVDVEEERPRKRVRITSASEGTQVNAHSDKCVDEIEMPCSGTGAESAPILEETASKRDRQNQDHATSEPSEMPCSGTGAESEPVLEEEPSNSEGQNQDHATSVESSEMPCSNKGVEGEPILEEEPGKNEEQNQDHATVEPSEIPCSNTGAESEPVLEEEPSKNEGQNQDQATAEPSVIPQDENENSQVLEHEDEGILDTEEVRSAITETNQDELYALEVKNMLECVRNMSSKMSSWGPSVVKATDVIVNADYLFQFGSLIIQMWSGENLTQLIDAHKDKLPIEFLELFDSSNINTEVLKQCLQQYTLNDLLQQLSSSEFITNVSEFLSGLEESATVLNATNLFNIVFSEFQNLGSASDPNLIVLTSDLLNSIFSRALDMLLKTFKFKNLLQCLINLTQSIVNLKNAIVENETMMKNWLEESILTSVEKKLEPKVVTISQRHSSENLKCSVDSAVQICVHDLLRKINQPEFAAKENLNDWFVNTIITKLEDDEIRDWLQDIVINKLESFLEKESLKDWLIQNVISQVESSFSDNHTFLERWLNETVLCKVCEKQDVVDVHDWVQELIDKVSVSERCSQELRCELEAWMSGVILKKVEELNKAELEHDVIKEWFREKIISVLDTDGPSDVTDKQCILTILYDAIEEMETKENEVHHDISEKLSDVIQEVVLENERDWEVQKWFNENVMNLIQEHSVESEEIRLWLEENLLQVLESTKRSENVDFKEVQEWLEKQLDTLEPNMTAFELKHWFEQNVLNVLYLDENNSKSCLNEEVKQLLNGMVIGVSDQVDEAGLSKDVQMCLDEQVLDIVETTCSIVDTSEKESASHCSSESEHEIVPMEIEFVGSSDYRTIQETSADLSNDILDVVEVTSGILDNLSNMNNVVDRDAALIGNESAQGNLSEDTSEVSECLNNSVLDVIDTTSSLLNDVQSCDTRSSKECSVALPENSESVTQYQELRKLSVFDAVNEMSEFVHSVNALIEVIDEEPMETEEVETLESNSSSTVLNKNILDEIHETIDLVNSASKLGDVLNSSPSQTHDKDSETNTTNTNDSDKSGSANTTIKAGTDEESALGTVRITPVLSDSLESVLGTSLRNSVSNIVEVVDITRGLVNTVHSESCTDSLSTQDVIEIFENPGSSVSAVDSSVVNILDIVSTTTKLVDSVHELNSAGLVNTVHSESCTDPLSTQDVIEIFENQGSSPSAADSSVVNILDIVSTTTKLVDSVHELNSAGLVNTVHSESCTDPLSTQDVFEIFEHQGSSASVVGSSVVDILDIVSTTTKLVDSVHELNSSAEVQVLKPAEAATCAPISCEDDHNKPPNEDSEQVGRGKRKRKKPGSFETNYSGRISDFEQIRFVSRPWRKPDGFLNRKVLERYLIAILGYIMTNPGLTRSQLFERFEPTMQPIFILELVEILSECECVSIQYLKKSHAPGLFSEPVSYQFLTNWEPGCEVSYEGTLDCILKLTYFLSDFLHYRH